MMHEHGLREAPMRNLYDVISWCFFRGANRGFHCYCIFALQTNKNCAKWSGTGFPKEFQE